MSGIQKIETFNQDGSPGPRLNTAPSKVKTREVDVFNPDGTLFQRITIPDLSYRNGSITVATRQELDLGPQEFRVVIIAAKDFDFTRFKLVETGIGNHI